MKKLLIYLKDYKLESIVGPLFKLLEACFELIVPLLVADVINNAIPNGDAAAVRRTALIMVLFGVLGLVCSITAQFFAAKAAVGFGAAVRSALFKHVNTLSHAELDRIGSSGLITRLTADVDQAQAGVNLVLRLLLRSLARNESTTATNKTLMKDIKAVDDEDIDGNTVAAYLDIFKRLFITDNQPPFSSGIRSSVRVKQAEKRHFADPSLACALLKATPASLLGDLETLGFLFEALCERDLRIYAESFGAQLYHYQDYKNQEIDAVVELPDGQWCAFEIKLGANQIDAAALNLLEIKKQIEADPKGKPPAVLCVLCGMANAAYQRPDGVFVVPVTALKN